PPPPPPPSSMSSWSWTGMDGPSVVDRPPRVRFLNDPPPRATPPPPFLFPSMGSYCCTHTHQGRCGSITHQLFLFLSYMFVCVHFMYLPPAGAIVLSCTVRGGSPQSCSIQPTDMPLLVIYW